MSISGLVLTLSDDDSAGTVVSTLAADPRITLGEKFGRRLAIVAETSSVESDRELWDYLRGLPGITNVDVTFVHLDDQPVTSKTLNHTNTEKAHHAHC